MRGFAIGIALALAALVAAPAAAQIFSEPAVEVMPATGQVRGTLVFLSGDLGWRHSFGRKAISGVRAAGFTVVGMDSAAFFDRERTAAETARWIVAAAKMGPKAAPLVLAGQSFGADVLPAAIPLLPAELRARVKGVALIVPAETRLWKISLAERLGLVDGEPGVADGRWVAARFPMLCLRGAEETDSLCPFLAGAGLTQVVLPGGHYLDRDTDAMGAALEGWLARLAPG